MNLILLHKDRICYTDLRWFEYPNRPMVTLIKDVVAEDDIQFQTVENKHYFFEMYRDQVIFNGCYMVPMLDLKPIKPEECTLLCEDRLNKLIEKKRCNSNWLSQTRMEILRVAQTLFSNHPF